MAESMCPPEDGKKDWSWLDNELVEMSQNAFKECLSAAHYAGWYARHNNTELTEKQNFEDWYKQNF